MVSVMAGFHMFHTSPPHISEMPGIMIHHTSAEPRQMMSAYFSPMIKPRPSTAAPVYTWHTSFAFSAMVSPNGSILVEMVSFQRPNVLTMKSYRPPTSPAKSNVLAWLPPFSPDTSTCVVAVASGKGYLPCMSATKYLRNGMRNSMPSTPPSSELKNTWKKLTVISGYFTCRM